MKKKILTYAILSAMGLTVIGAGMASAHGFGFFGGLNSLTPDQIAQRQATMFQDQADILSVSVDDIKNAWAEGKSLKTLAQEKGISQDQIQTRLNKKRTKQLKSYLQTLVDKGVISQEQADKRLQFSQNQLSNGNGKNKIMRGFGLHGMMW